MKRTRRPLRRAPERAEDDPEDKKDLANEKLGRSHRFRAGSIGRGARRSWHKIATKSILIQWVRFQRDPTESPNGSSAQLKHTVSKIALRDRQRMLHSCNLEYS